MGRARRNQREAIRKQRAKRRKKNCSSSDCSDSEFDHTTIKNSGLETVSLDRDESAATAGCQKMRRGYSQLTI